MKKIIIIFFLLTSCGFKPIYKVSDLNQNLMSFDIEFINPNQISRLIKDEVNEVLKSKDDNNYKILMKVDEDKVPLIINTNGTVAKYRITVVISFTVSEIINENLIIEGSARGQAQYDVGNSEIANEDERKQMTKLATGDAIQIMMSKILSGITSVDDN